MTKLSLAAEAVLDAYMNNCGWLDGPFEKDYRCAAAVLRAAADQVAPLNYEDVWTDGKILQYEKHDSVREKLLAIADELESQ
jgi:hypothetical protein